MKVFIIGGTNFIGLHTANEFIKNGHDVTVFHRNLYTGSDLSKNVKHILGDRSNQLQLSEAIQLTDPDMVIDMYAMSEQDIFVLEESLLRRTRVLVVSSSDVYEAYSVFSNPASHLQAVPLAENSMLRNDLFPYRGKFDFSFAHDYEKILVEQAARSSGKMETVVVRLGMIYGENDPNHRFKLPLEQLIQNKIVTIPKNASAWTVSKGYVKDIAYGIYLAACKGQPNEIYNLAEEYPVSECEWMKRIAKSIGWEGKFEISGNDASGANWAQNLIVDTEKIRSQLGYTEKYSIEQALKNTLHWENSVLRIV